MIVVHIMFWIGCILCLPIFLYGFIRGLLLVVKWWKSEDWAGRLEGSFYVGITILLLGGLLKAAIETYPGPITAAPSTDTTEQIPLQVENLNQEELPK